MKEVYNGAFDLEFDKRQMDETMDHSQLDHRNDPDQHEIGAITGLEEALAGQDVKILNIENSVSDVERLGEDVEAKLAELLEYEQKAKAGIETAEAAAVAKFAEEVDLALPDATATAVTLPTGTPATANVDYENDVLTFEFGLPAGIKGDRGFRGYRGPGLVDGTGSGIHILDTEILEDPTITYPYFIDYEGAEALLVYSALDCLAVGDNIRMDDKLYPIRKIIISSAAGEIEVEYYFLGDTPIIYLDDPTSIKGADGQDGQDGQDYVLTQQDIEDISDNVAEILGNADDDWY